MKFLINSEFKALRTGEYVSADESAGEFIFDSENCDMSVATLMEIAAGNKVAAKKDKKENVIEVLVAGLSKLKLPSMNEKPASEKVKEIVEAGIAEGLSDDEMLIKIVQSGIKFKLAGKLFTQVMTAGGYRVSNKERKAAIREILVEAEFQPEEYQEITDIIAKICKQVADTDAAQAMQGIKAYAKEFEIELPKPDKKSGGFKTVVRNAVIANPLITLAEFRELCESKKKDADKMEKTVWPQVQFAKAVARAAIVQELSADDFKATASSASEEEEGDEE